MSARFRRLLAISKVVMKQIEIRRFPDNVLHVGGVAEPRLKLIGWQIAACKLPENVERCDHHVVMTDRLKLRALAHSIRLSA